MAKISSKELGNTLRRDRRLCDLAQSFLLMTKDAGEKSKEEFRLALRTMSFRIVDDVRFVISDELRETERQLVIQAVNLLGGRLGNEKDVSAALWTFAVSHFQRGGCASTDDVSQLILALTKDAEITVQCVLPNQLVTLANPIEFFDIGPVKVASSSHTASSLKTKAPQKMNFVPMTRAGFELSLEDGELDVGIGPVCWIVEITAAPGNLEEEAIWLVDVAASILRFAHKRATGLFPRLGEVEPHPTEELSKRSVRAVIKGDGVSVTGTSLITCYQVDEEVLSWLNEPRIANWIQRLFEPRKGTVAERVHAGLGWLSRGRRSKGRAERLLYFFTALEAVLSGPEKTDPVLQTVSRNTAVILSNDIHKRATIARDIKRLYSRRSALVHSGRRDISKGSATSVQLFAEGVFYAILEHVDPDERFDTFHAVLATATFGSSWPESDAQAH